MFFFLQLLERVTSVDIEFLRLFILMVYVTDAIALCFLWNKQRQLDISSEIGKFLVPNLVIANFLGKLAASCMIFFRWNVRAACALLFTVLCIRVMALFLITIYFCLSSSWSTSFMSTDYEFLYPVGWISVKAEFDFRYRDYFSHSC